LINKYFEEKWEDIEVAKCYTYIQKKIERCFETDYECDYFFEKFKLRKDEINSIGEMLKVLMSGSITLSRKYICDFEIGDLIINFYRNSISKVIKKENAKEIVGSLKSKMLLQKKY
jgi:hypothetical protein